MLARYNRGLGFWNPWREFDQLNRELTRMFDWPDENRSFNMGDTARSFLEEHDGSYTVKVTLPGINPKDIELEVCNDFVSLNVKRELPELAEGERYLQHERFKGEFRQSFRLPGKVKSSDVKASYNDGVLTIDLPKVEIEKPKQIKVA